MLDPTIANYVDILVNQMIKKPEAVLDRLSSDQQLTEIPNIALSKFLYCNGQALPLPRLTDEERKDIRKDIDNALERLTRWENTSNQAVPQLNLRDIKKKHRDRKKSQDSVCKSPEVYVTAREGVEDQSYCGIVRGVPHEVRAVDQEELRKPGVASKIPVCQYSSSPMVSKAYKPLSAVSSEDIIVKRNSTSTTIGDITGNHPPTSITADNNTKNTTVPNNLSSSSADSAQDDINPIPDVAATPQDDINPIPDVADTPQDNISPIPDVADTPKDNISPIPDVANAPQESALSDQSSSREELELYNSKSLVLEPGGSHGELELSNSQSLMLGLSNSLECAESGSTEVTGDAVVADGGETVDSVITSSMLRTSEKSPPSSQVLRHLEALEAVIELDMTMQSTAALQSTPTAALRSAEHPTPTSAAKRRLDLNSSPSTPDPAETRRPFSLNLTGKVGTRKLPDQPDTSPTTSSPSTPRRGISFYVEVDSPHSPRSPRASLARRNTIASPRSTTDLPRVVNKVSSPRTDRKYISGAPGRARSSSALLSSTAHSVSPQSEPLLPPPPPPGPEEGEESSVLGGEQIVTPRRVRNESYNTDCSLVIDERASKITALIRGYLTRALLNSYKAQQHVKTIRDTQEILSGYEVTSEMCAQDRAFYDRLKDTLQQTKERLHVIFFNTSISDQMTLIANTRSARRELHHKEGKLVKPGSARKRMVKKTVRQKAWI